MNDISMPCVTLRGRPVKDRLLVRVADAIAARATPPKLLIVQVGNNAESTVYIAGKVKAAQAVGMDAEVVHLPLTITEEDALETIARHGADEAVDGMIIQLPLPEGWNVQRILDVIPAAKDVDGLGRAQQTLQAANDPAAIWPATPLGVMRLLAAYDIEVKNKRVVVVGQSNLVGRPLAALMRQAGAQVVSFGKDEPEPAARAREADILCVATGVPGLITTDWVKPGAVVIDVGITRRPNALGEIEIVGDVAPEVAQVASALTPVPGGVGPLTVASLLANVARVGG